MKRFNIITKPVKPSDLIDSDFYHEISNGWEERARKLQARRWRALKRSVKSTEHAAGKA